MKAEITAFFRSKGKIITPEALALILQKKEPLEFAKELCGRVEKSIIEVEDLKEPEPEKEVKVLKTHFKPLAKDVESQFKAFEEYDVTGKSESEGKVGDFVDNFRDRFKRLSRILRGRGDALKNIELLKRRKIQEETRVIGMISGVKTTTNGHKIINLEDESASLVVFVHKNEKALMAQANQLLVDEVIAVDGKMYKDLFITKAIYRPDVPVQERRRADEDVCVAMTSDIHVGSKLFIKEKFEKFLDWINGDYGDAKQVELAGKVKYITIAGDLVDGCGIYPNQEEELLTDDIYGQYEELYELLEKVPEYVEIIAIPGNHDAVRVADPQPAISKDVLGKIAGMQNFHIMSSPGYCSVHGVEILLYHGASIHSIVPHVPGITYNSPERVVIEYLQRRHVHPVYGERPPITPEKRDYLVIERVPDIFQVADVHRNGYLTYRGVVGINAGTWQAKTAYQLQKGHHPTPCILPIVNLKTSKLNILKFQKEGGQ